MKLYQIFKILFLLALTSCFNIRRDEVSEYISSPSKKYLIQLHVNSTDRSKENYADVCVKLFDANQNFMSELNTHAGDANKWAIDWNTINDTLIMKSSDIGNYAWKISNGKFERIKMNSELNKKAESIFENKYRN